MESVMIAHHASETLLRLFFAHIEHEECPWLGMSASTDFAEFKGKVADALRQGFDRGHIASVFLGGDTPADACIELSENEFDDAIGNIASFGAYQVDVSSSVSHASPSKKLAACSAASRSSLPKTWA
jgi:hypothetical protein